MAASLEILGADQARPCTVTLVPPSLTEPIARTKSATTPPRTEAAMSNGRFGLLDRSDNRMSRYFDEGDLRHGISMATRCR